MKVYSQLEQASAENLAATPANLPLGRFWFDTVLNKLGIRRAGVTDHVVSETLAQPLTNKTINASLNTITNITSAMITDGTLVDADISASAAIALSKLATGALPSAITVTSANITDLTITDADVSASAAIALSKLATGALPSAITVASANIVDDSIVNADINTAAAIALSKLATGALPTAITIASANIVDLTIVNADIANSTIDLTAKVTGTLPVAQGGTGVTSSTGSGANVLGTSPAITTPTGIVKNDVGLGNVDNTSNATERAAVAVLTNKDIDGGVATDARRITMPKATLATLNALARKQGTLVYDTTGNKPYFDDGVNLKVIGSGSGGVENFIGDGANAEAGTTGWATYADAAGAKPVDGTAGAASITWTASAVAPLLHGSNSFRFTKDAVNRQGHGASYDFTIPLGHRAKALTIKVPYIVQSGTFVAGTSTADSDVIVYFYDITNAKLVEASSFKLLSNSTTIADVFQAQVQFDSTCTSARIIFHTASVSAIAYVVAFDDILVGPSQYVFGTPITDLVSFTPTGSWTTNTTYTGRWSRVGDMMLIDITAVLSGAPTATGFNVNIPSGFTIDTAKMSNSAEYSKGFGSAQLRDASANFWGAHIRYRNSTSVHLTVNNGNVVSETVPFTWATGDAISLTFEVPILGWSSSVQMSDQTDTRVVALAANGSATVVSGSEATIVWTNTERDTHGAFNGTTYTVPVAGFYRVGLSVRLNSASAAVNNLDILGIKKNGGAVALALGHPGSTSDLNRWRTSFKTFHCVAGDAITCIISSDTGTPSISTQAVYTNLSIERISGPNQISATESVNAKSHIGSNKSITTDTIIDFDTAAYSSHGGVTTGAAWKYTAPISGTYQISVNLIFDAAVYTVGNMIFAEVYKGGTVQTRIADATAQTTTSVFLGMSGTDDIKLLAGEFIDVRATNQRGATNLLASGARLNTIKIKRVGN